MTLSIPGYEILETLGKGGMATVYLARQAIFERKVALKVMSKSLAENPAFGQRFLREARIVSELVHPNIVAVYQVGVHDDMYYLAMEYLQGQELKQLIPQLSIPEKICIIRDVASALGFSGSKGYVHRDIKPENIIYNRETSRAVLTDFGIARAAELDASVTHTGITIGTPHYMSPEQAKGGVVDHRSDLYSLGAVMFILLTGEVPYTAESAVAIGIKHITSPVPLLPEELESLQPIIDRLLAKAPEDRYQEASQLIHHLNCIDLSLFENVQLDYSALASDSLEDATTEVYTAFETDEMAVEERRNGFRKALQLLHICLLMGGIFAVFWYALHTQDVDRWLASDTKPTTVDKPLGFSTPAARKPLDAKIPPTSAAPPEIDKPLTANELRLAIAELKKELVSSEVPMGALVSAYRSLLEIEPEDGAVQMALDQLHQDSLQRVNQLMEAGELDYAAKLLDEVRRLFPAVDIDLPELAEPVPVVDLALLQQQAESLFAMGNDTQPAGNNALEIYQQILAIDESNSNAVDGLRKIEAGLVQHGYRLLNAGDATAAEVLAKKALNINPDSPDAKALLDQVFVTLSETIQREKMLNEAEQLLSTGLLFYPEGKSAYDLFNRILVSDPKNQRALAGQDVLIEALSSQVWRMVEEGQLDQAAQVLKRPMLLWPNNQRIRSLAGAVDAVSKE